MLSPDFDAKQNEIRLNGLFKDCYETPWRLAVDPIWVTPKVYYLGNSWIGVYVVRTSEGLLLIDSGMPTMLYLIFEGIRQCGDDPKMIKKVLLTHGHYDHCGAMRQVLEYTGARCYMSHLDLPYIQTAVPELLTMGYPYEGFTPDEYFDPAVPVTLGEFSFQTILSPGHTPGTTAIFFTDTNADGKKIRVGMHGGLGLNTLLDNCFPAPELAQKARDEYRQGLLALENESVNLTISPHPGVVNLIERAAQYQGNTVLLEDPALWKSTIVTSLKRLDTLEAQLRSR